jgi:single-strand DNA-binding protein
MYSFNRVILMGNLTRDPELRVINKNSQVCHLGLATNRRYTDQAGNPQDEVTFVDCEAWGAIAKVISDHLTKGQPIHIEGRLRLDQWQSDDGDKRSKLKVVVENFQFVGDRPKPREGEPAPT